MSENNKSRFAEAREVLNKIIAKHSGPDCDTHAECLKRADPLANFLNELLKLDPVWVKTLMEARFPCNEQIANHPAVNVTSEGTAGLIGFLNGFIGRPPGRNRGYLAAVSGDDGSIHSFAVLD